MKVLHTADWHLGKVLNGYSFIELQKDMVRQIVDICVDNEIDVVVIAGDIYDRAIPSVDAIQLFNDFLTEVAIKFKKQIILITGNHDSYDRLRFGNDIFKAAGIYIANNETKTFDKLTLEDEYGSINFYLWPYSSYYLLKEKYSEQGLNSYNDYFDYLLSENEIDSSVRNCFVGHSYYTYGMEKCIESDSERQLAVGGADFLDAKLLKDFDIAMFGHLHGPQKVGSPFHRYAGTPLKYSFSEVKHHKSVTIFDIKEKGNVTNKQIEIKPLQDMKIVKGYLEDIVKNGVDGVAKDDLIQLILLDEEKIFEPMASVRERYPNVLELKYVEKVIDEHIVFEGEEYKSKGMVELFSDFYEKINDQEITEDEKEIVTEVYEKVLEGVTDEN